MPAAEKPDNVAIALATIGKKRLPKYRSSQFGDSAPADLAAFARDFQPFVEWADVGDFYAAGHLLKAHGPDGCQVIRAAFVEAYPSHAPIALWRVVAMIDSVVRWGMRDGEIKWDVPADTPGETRINALVPRDLAREIRIRAAETERTLQAFIVDAVTAHLHAPFGKRKELAK